MIPHYEVSQSVITILSKLQLTRYFSAGLVPTIYAERAIMFQLRHYPIFTPMLLIFPTTVCNNLGC